MNVVTLGIATIDDQKARLAAAFHGEQQGQRIAFASIDLLWKILSPKRLDILRAMAGQGALSIREIARRVGRDVKAVHGDIHALIDAGVVDHNAKGVSFPYDAVHIDFILAKAA